MNITQDEIEKIYDIVVIALTTEMTDIMSMVKSNGWYEFLDTNISVASFKKLINLSLQCKTNYFTLLKRNFPKLLEQCSHEYKEFVLKVQQKKRFNKCYYYDNTKYNIYNLMQYLYEGCVINSQHNLYIVNKDEFVLLPLNNNGEYYIPIDIAKKYSNPYTFFGHLMQENVLSCIHLCPYTHRTFIESIMKLDINEKYFLYDDKLTNTYQCFLFRIS